MLFNCLFKKLSTFLFSSSSDESYDDDHFFGLALLVVTTRIQVHRIKNHIVEIISIFTEGQLNLILGKMSNLTTLH